MKIQVGNGTYEVDDNFGQLSPSEQDKVLQEITAGEQTHTEAKQASSDKKEAAAVPPNWYDVTNSQSGIRQYAIDPALAVGAEHPYATAYGASYVPGLNKLPVISDIKNLRQTAGNLATRGANIASNMMNGASTPNPSGPVTPSNYTPSGNPTRTVNITNIPNTPNPTSVGQAAEAGTQAVDHAGIMNKIAELYKAYGPAVGDHLATAGKVISENPLINNPVTRFAGSRLGGGLMAALHSSELNQGEDEQLKQIHQMTQNVNPNLPNAFTSGFANQLNTGRRVQQQKSIFEK